MNEYARPLDDLYFEWLYGFVGSFKNRNRSKSYQTIAGMMYRTPFDPFVPNDANRANDGIELRLDFLATRPDLEFDQDWFELECSVLELMIVLARDADYQAFEGLGPYGVSGWFKEFLVNLKLDKYTDDMCTPRTHFVVQRRLRALNERTYNENGQGGLFPLRRPDRDQRRVELWYQLNSYLLDRKYVDAY